MATVFLASAMILAGCEKDEKDNKIIGTWIECGASLSGDPTCGYIDDPESEIDTISFRSNHKMKDNYKRGYTGYKYNLISDTLLIVQDDSHYHEHPIKFSNDNLIIYNWRHRENIAEIVVNVCFRKKSKKHW